MKRPTQRGRLTRLLSALLILALGLPTPSAWALRPTIQGRVETGLEEALRGEVEETDPTSPVVTAGLEEAADLVGAALAILKESVRNLYANITEQEADRLGIVAPKQWKNLWLPESLQGVLERLSGSERAFREGKTALGHDLLDSAVRALLVLRQTPSASEVNVERAAAFQREVASLVAPFQDLKRDLLTRSFVRPLDEANAWRLLESMDRFSLTPPVTLEGAIDLMLELGDRYEARSAGKSSTDQMEPHFRYQLRKPGKALEEWRFIAPNLAGQAIALLQSEMWKADPGQQLVLTFQKKKETYQPIFQVIGEFRPLQGESAAGLEENGNGDDPATVLRNREEGEAKALAFLNETHPGQPVALVFGDVDWLRSLNRLYSRWLVDPVFAEVLSTVSSEVGSQRGIAYRYGGDEFVFLVPIDADLQGRPLQEVFSEQTDRIRKAVAAAFSNRFLVVQAATLKAAREFFQTLETPFFIRAESDYAGSHLLLLEFSDPHPETRARYLQKVSEAIAQHSGGDVRLFDVAGNGGQFGIRRAGLRDDPVSVSLGGQILPASRPAVTRQSYGEYLSQAEDRLAWAKKAHPFKNASEVGEEVPPPHRHEGTRLLTQPPEIDGEQVLLERFTPGRLWSKVEEDISGGKTSVLLTIIPRYKSSGSADPKLSDEHGYDRLKAINEISYAAGNDMIGSLLEAVSAAAGLFEDQFEVTVSRASLKLPADVIQVHLTYKDSKQIPALEDTEARQQFVQEIHWKVSMARDHAERFLQLRAAAAQKENRFVPQFDWAGTVLDPSEGSGQGWAEERYSDQMKDSIHLVFVFRGLFPSVKQIGFLDHLSFEQAGGDVTKMFYPEFDGLLPPDYMEIARLGVETQAQKAALAQVELIFAPRREAEKEDEPEPIPFHRIDAPHHPIPSPPTAEATGLEEGEWMAQMRSLLQPLYGDRTDQLSSGDLKILRRAGTIGELQNLLGALNVALGGRGEEGPSPVLEMTIPWQIQNSGLLYQWLPIDLSHPGVTLQGYLRAMPREVAEKMLRFLESTDLKKIGEVKQVISSYVQTAKEDDEWALRLAVFVEPDLSDELVQQMVLEAREILKAMDPQRSEIDVERAVNSWRERTLAPNLDGIVRQIDVEMSGRGDSEMTLKLLVNKIVGRLLGVYFHERPKEGLPWIVLSRKRVPSDAAFFAKARHELMHGALGEAGLIGQRFPSDPLMQINAEDWLAMIAELAFVDPQKLGSETVLPPAILKWLKEKGRRIATEATATWFPQIGRSVGWMPPGWHPYAIGTVNAGVAEALAEEVLPDGNESDKRRLALEFIGRFARYSDRPITLEELGPAARAFRSEHDLPEESATGLEEQQAVWRAASELTDGFRSVSAADSQAVVGIGRELAERFPGLQVLAGLEDRVVISRGDPYDTLIQLARWGGPVYFYGGLEEGRQLEALALNSGMLLSFVLPDPAAYPTDRLLLRGILTNLQIPANVISAGLEELYRSIEQLGNAA